MVLFCLRVPSDFMNEIDYHTHTANNSITMNSYVRTRMNVSIDNGLVTCVVD